MIKITNFKEFQKLPNERIAENCDTIFLLIILDKITQIVLQFGNWIEPDPTIELDEEGNDVEVIHKPYFEAKNDYIYNSQIKINNENFAIATHEEAIKKIKEFAPNLELEIFGL